METLYFSIEHLMDEYLHIPTGVVRVVVWENAEARKVHTIVEGRSARLLLRALRKRYPQVTRRVRIVPRPVRTESVMPSQVAFERLLRHHCGPEPVSRSSDK